MTWIVGDNEFVHSLLFLAYAHIALPAPSASDSHHHALMSINARLSLAAAPLSAKLDVGQRSRRSRAHLRAAHLVWDKNRAVKIARKSLSFLGYVRYCFMAWCIAKYDDARRRTISQYCSIMEPGSPTR